MSLVDFLAWSAAEDASSAARSAEEAINSAREEADRQERVRVSQARHETINKMLQDLFYDREVDYYKISNIKNSLGDGYGAQPLFPINYGEHGFPYKSLIIGSVLAYFSANSLINVELHHHESHIFLYIITTIFLLVAFVGLKRWYWYRTNIERLREERMVKVKNLYEKPMSDLAKEFSMLTRSGIVRKYRIDSQVLETYKALRDQDETKARAALLQLYYLLFNLDEGDKFSSDEEARLTNIFLEESIYKDWDNKGILFSKEALDIYKENL